MLVRNLIGLSVCGFIAAAAAAQPVQGQVDAVGFTTSGGVSIREGQWFPIVVTLRSQGSNIFSGELRVQCVDLDGDHLAYRLPQIVVGSETGGQKRFWCYGVANQTNELPENVEVIDLNGALVARLPLTTSQQPQALANDALLILDISNPQITALDRLRTPAGESVPAYYRDVVIAHMPPAELPDRWWGLEARERHRLGSAGPIRAHDSPA